MSTKHLMIACVPSAYNHHVIADIFWNCQVAQLAAVTLIPYLKDDSICSIAYLTVYKWCDTEVAYVTIKELQTKGWSNQFLLPWKLEVNTHNNGLLNAGPYTVIFDTPILTPILPPPPIKRQITKEQKEEEEWDFDMWVNTLTGRRDDQVELDVNRFLDEV